MHLSWDDLESRLANALARRSVPSAREIAWACVWLQACGYPGLGLLAEALKDEVKSAPLMRDALGLDLKNVSCVYLASQVLDDVAKNGRVFLHNVRHGLFLVPFSVRDELAIGCPVDPAFALGGPREKNPYAEKLDAARQAGLEVDPALLDALTG
jgi:hypothetical protein